MVRNTDLKVLLCPEDQSQMDVAKEMLFDPLPEDVRKRVVHRSTYWLTDEALSTYVRSAGLFGLEMHSPIMCIGNGVPAVVCRFSEQTSKGFMWRDIGLEDWLFDMDKEDEVRGSFRRSWGSRRIRRWPRPVFRRRMSLCSSGRRRRWECCGSRWGTADPGCLNHKTRSKLPNITAPRTGSRGTLVGDARGQRPLARRKAVSSDNIGRSTCPSADDVSYAPLTNPRGLQSQRCL